MRVAVFRSGSAPAMALTLPEGERKGVTFGDHGPHWFVISRWLRSDLVLPVPLNCLAFALNLLDGHMTKVEYTASFRARTRTAGTRIVSWRGRIPDRARKPLHDALSQIAASAGPYR